MAERTMSELIPIEDVHAGDVIRSPWNTYEFRVTEIGSVHILGVFTRKIGIALGYAVGSPAAYRLDDWRFSDPAWMARKMTAGE